jgi:hypothetical protein
MWKSNLVLCLWLSSDAHKNTGHRVPCVFHKTQRFSQIQGTQTRIKHNPVHTSQQKHITSVQDQEEPPSRYIGRRDTCRNNCYIQAKHKRTFYVSLIVITFWQLIVFNLRGEHTITGECKQAKYLMMAEWAETCCKERQMYYCGDWIK